MSASDWQTAVILGVAFIGFVWWEKRKKQRGSSGPVLFVPVAGAPARRGPGLLVKVLIFAAVIVGLFMAADWLNGHAPPAPGHR